MKVGELRALIRDLPDGAVVVAEAGDGEWFELNPGPLYHPACGVYEGEVLEYPTTLGLHGGQPINLDLGMDDREEESWSVRPTIRI